MADLRVTCTNGGHRRREGRLKWKTGRFERHWMPTGRHPTRMTSSWNTKSTERTLCLSIRSRPSVESTFVGTVRCALETTLRYPAKSGRADGSASRARQTASWDSTFAGIGSSAARGPSTDERFRGRSSQCARHTLKSPARLGEALFRVYASHRHKPLLPGDPTKSGGNAMAAVDIPISGLSETDHRAQLLRALIASTVGTTIEWYDFLLYGQVTGLVFGKLFFPQSDPIVGVLQAFAVFFVGFLGRPIGAAIFGHWGDRIGRKATLIATLLVTGVATMAVGLVPTYESIGIWGAVLLVVIRLIQGIGVGGEWGGSVLLAMEWARSNKNRGLLAAWPQFGGPAGLFLANLAVLFFSWYSGDQFLVWGWRIPFL